MYLKNSGGDESSREKQPKLFYYSWITVISKISAYIIIHINFNFTDNIFPALVFLVTTEYNYDGNRTVS